MPEKRTKQTAGPRKTAAKAAAPKKALPKPAARPLPGPAPKAALPAGEVCPRCGTSKFGPEDRIRAEGNRTVRYAVLVCERGHTFARPVIG